MSIYNVFLILFVMGFLLGIKLMNSPETAVKGNLLGAFSMLLAIILTLSTYGIVTLSSLWISLAVGGIIGLVIGYRVTMIQMPQLVALLNGLGGGASAVTSFVVLWYTYHNPIITRFTGGLALAVGSMTFSGSMIAAAKLDRKINQQPILIHAHTLLSVALLLLIGLFIILFILATETPLKLLLGLILLISLTFGLIFSIRIGGADMPITISLLNSLSGIAGSITGFTIGNPLLVAVGAIVGSAGLILTRIMCRAMNRTLFEVIIGKTTLRTSDSAALTLQEKISPKTGEIETKISEKSPQNYETITEILQKAHSIVIVPGYGMAVSQAQHHVKQLFDKLVGQGKDVKFAIHPVAGRMPGHMNVLLAEVDITYDRIFEMDDINPEFNQTDLVIVVGANDVINPAAKTAEGTPIYGMPILKVNEAKQLIVCNIDTKPGYAGVDNPLYEQENVILLLGDAKETIGNLVRKME